VFDPGPVRVGFVVDIVALGQTFFRVTYLSPVSNIPLMLHTYYFQRCVVLVTDTSKQTPFFLSLTLSLFLCVDNIARIERYHFLNMCC
jgi:hypothetical protein